ncbi:peptidoglycan recognition protein family protein [Kocuria sp.]|uniref:peptidoglycan recognition protein family protein n=1 Tax=Kocuria sp. TaxID=1871328 RepID=UPI0026DFE4C5|nr:peptidoglycan recognition family protein [Kocuria sp.]MDO5618015.1 peptidoglycan recognition family protein [Kocuria sp.]
MPYTYETKHTAVHQSSRANFGHTGNPTGITIHHWGLDGQSHDGVVQYLCSNRPANPTSAHYVVSAGKVSCIVEPARAAWHAGSAQGNGQTIGIECRPEMSPGDWATLVELMSDLEQFYGDLKVYPHNYWSSTSCPGRYGPRLNELIAAVNAENTRRKQSTAVKTVTTAPTTTSTKIGDLAQTYFPTEVTWAVDKGLMTLRKGQFEPFATVSRQDLAIILNRMNKKGL